MCIGGVTQMPNPGMKRLRCDCTGCSRSDCGDCNYCKDMKKFGGPGKKKKRCIHRVCRSVKLSCMAKSMASNQI